MFLASTSFFDFSFFDSIAFDFLIATDANRKSCLVNCLLRLVRLLFFSCLVDCLSFSGLFFDAGAPQRYTTTIS